MEGTQLDQPDVDDISMLDVLHALADPVRLQLVRTLDRSGRDYCSALVGDLDLHKSTLSHHWKVLREAGLTSTFVVGRDRVVELRRPELDRRFPGLLDAVIAGLA